MTFRKGQSGNPKGKPRGTKTRQTVSVKQAFIDAFDKLGGVAALVRWAKTEPAEFYRLFGRLIPQEVAGPGPGGEIVLCLLGSEMDPRRLLTPPAANGHADPLPDHPAP